MRDRPSQMKVVVARSDPEVADCPMVVAEEVRDGLERVSHESLFLSTRSKRLDTLKMFSGVDEEAASFRGPRW